MLFAPLFVCSWCWGGGGGTHRLGRCWRSAARQHPRESPPQQEAACALLQGWCRNSTGTVRPGLARQGHLLQSDSQPRHKLLHCSSPAARLCLAPWPLPSHKVERGGSAFPILVCGHGPAGAGTIRPVLRPGTSCQWEGGCVLSSCGHVGPVSLCAAWHEPKP